MRRSPFTDHLVAWAYGMLAQALEEANTIDVECEVVEDEVKGLLPAPSVCTEAPLPPALPNAVA